MKAVIYEIEISEGILASIHGFIQKIREIYIPEENISLNLANDGVNYFETHKCRYEKAKKIGQTDVPNTLVMAIVSSLKSKKDVECGVKEWQEAKNIFTE